MPGSPIITRRPGRIVGRVSFPLREFLHTEAAGGIILFVAALTALVWANSPWASSYVDLWATRLTLGSGHLAITETLGHWINDGLMAVFFFVVGLEIKRELLIGEMTSLRQATLPIAAALGGVLAPAAIYVAINRGTAGSDGWGIPMATDIAFALGALALLGDSVSTALKLFLTVLAIVDDLIAVLVIAVFYTADIAWDALGVAALALMALVALNRLGVRRPLPYVLLGLVLWVAFLESGIHATIAGVLLALTIPARTRLDPDQFVARGQELLDEFSAAGEHGHEIYSNGARQSAAQELAVACERVGSPLQRLEHMLHPWVAFAIVPVFALANAGVNLRGGLGGVFEDHVTIGVVLGLVLGKQLGITAFAWLATRTGLAELPAGVGWRQIYGTAWLAGIGFTMSLFIAGLAFDDAALLASAKVGILVASALAGLVGWALLRISSDTDST